MSTIPDVISNPQIMPSSKVMPNPQANGLEYFQASKKSGVGDRPRTDRPFRNIFLALASLVVNGVVGAGTYFMGMLMLMFSLDSASANQIPSWLEIYMLVGWPAIICLAALIPSFMIGLGCKRKWVWIAYLDGVILVGVSYVIGVAVAMDAIL